MTDAEKVDTLTSLPWTIVPHDGAEAGYRVLRIAELPEFLATGATDEELEADFWDALEALMESYVEHGDQIPLPEGVQLPWDVPAPVEAVIPQTDDTAPSAPEPGGATLNWGAPYEYEHENEAPVVAAA